MLPPLTTDPSHASNGEHFKCLEKRFCRIPSKTLGPAFTPAALCKACPKHRREMAPWTWLLPGGRGWGLEVGPDFNSLTPCPTVSEILHPTKVHGQEQRAGGNRVLNQELSSDKDPNCTTSVCGNKVPP